MLKRHPPMSYAGAALVIVACVFATSGALTLASCASNPFKVAQTPEQKAFAAYGAFTVYEEMGAKLRADPAASARVVAALQAADAKAKPSADALLQALQDYERAESQLKAGTGTAEKMQIATQQLSNWIATATRDVQGLAAAVKGAKP